MAKEIHHSKSHIPPETVVALAAKRQETGDNQHEIDMSYSLPMQKVPIANIPSACVRTRVGRDLRWVSGVLGYQHGGIGNPK